MENRTQQSIFPAHLIHCIYILLSAIILQALFPVSASFAGEQATKRQEERDRMVDTQFSGGGRTTITDPQVLKAMRTVPRHLFIPKKLRPYAYDDTPIPIGYGQTISQPYIVALMTQALEITSGMKVLEIGTGSGYQAAILGRITSNTFTIEIIKPLYQRAGGVLKRLGYDSIKTFLGDGYYGVKDQAPFDRIIVTCAAQHVPPPLFEQLTPGGRMIIPVGGVFETQRLLLVTKDDQGKRSSKTLELVRFVPLLRGKPRAK